MIIDDLAPTRVVYPSTLEELSEAVAAEKGSIVPVGTGTQLEFGNPLKSADCAVSLTRLNRVTTYNPDELTIHVQAGVPIGQIQKLLSENNQALPLDPWNGSAATIGGIAAANAQGPLRATGSIRDWIIGMTVVHVDGHRSKTGGRVVKNVTGYDLAKLYTGSLGSLAVIAELSFKLRPNFGKTATAVASFARNAEVGTILATLRKGSLQPIACEWVGPRNELWIRIGEHPRAVDSQLSQLPAAPWKIYVGEEESVQWETLRKFCVEMGPIVLRVIGKPTDVQSIIEDSHPDFWIAHGLNGIVLLGISNPEIVEMMRRRFPVIIERAPKDVRRQIGTFGVSGRVKQLMLDMKNSFDPERRLNPGRHIDGE